MSLKRINRHMELLDEFAIKAVPSIIEFLKGSQEPKSWSLKNIADLSYIFAEKMLECRQIRVENLLKTWADRQEGE